MKELIIEELDSKQTRLVIDGDTFAITQTIIKDGIREYLPAIELTKRGILNLHRAITNKIIGV